MAQNNGSQIAQDFARLALLPVTALLGLITLSAVLTGRMTWARYGRMWLKSLPFCD